MGIKTPTSAKAECLFFISEKAEDLYNKNKMETFHTPSQYGYPKYYKKVGR